MQCDAPLQQQAPAHNSSHSYAAVLFLRHRKCSHLSLPNESSRVNEMICEVCTFMLQPHTSGNTIYCSTDATTGFGQSAVIIILPAMRHCQFNIRSFIWQSFWSTNAEHSHSNIVRRNQALSVQYQVFHLSKAASTVQADCMFYCRLPATSKLQRSPSADLLLAPD